MPWQFLAQINLTHEWQVTSPVEGEIFRISHEPLDITDKDYLKAVISPAFVDDGLNLLSPKRLTYREEREIFLFYFPAGIALQQLAFKRLDSATDIEWAINAEIFISQSSQEDFSNYIIARFGELMPLFNQSVATVNIENAQLASSSEYKLLAANVATLIADTNPSRQGLVVFNPNNQDVVLGTNINAQNQLVGQMAKISKDGLYELPVTAHGCYTGKIYALSAVASGVSVTQFIPSV